MSLFAIPRKVCARIEKIQRNFLWGSGALEKRPHLVNWNLVCTHKIEGTLEIHNFVALNKTLFKKWSWRFAEEREPIWNQIIIRKFGVEDRGWCSRGVRGRYGVGVWKTT